MNIMNESFTPCEGIFWVVDGEILSYVWYVGDKGTTHEKIWHTCNINKDWDYYPRGRVMIHDYSNIIIFMDSCIPEKYKDKIISIFGLTQYKDNILWLNNLKERTGINHYTCHTCREK